MEFHDLGPLWIESAGLPRSLHGKRTEAVLSALLVRWGEVVSADWLIEAVWGEEPPPKASAALDTLLWRLRRTLDPDRPARTPSTVLRTEEQGYRLTVPAESVDSRRFAHAAATVAVMDKATDAVSILDLTATALGLWRGRPYDGVDDTGWLRTSRQELAEHRLTVQRCRIAALLAAGQPEQAVTELTPIIDEHPFVESFRAQRILGLYRSGRASAALDAFQDARRVLTDELGISPGPELRLLHHQILRHDESLGSPARPSIRQPGGGGRLPRRRTSLVGRQHDVEQVERLVSTGEIVTITGPIGCGKTRLAIAVAEQVRDRFGDGAYFVDLSDITDPELVAPRVREVVGVDNEAATPALRSITRFVTDRQVLLVLDNCEQVVDAVAGLIEAILDTAPGVAILTTSRQRLAVEGEHVYALQPLSLPRGSSPADLLASPAAALFAERLTGSASADPFDDEQRAAVLRICAATDGLPLSLELAAGRARIFQLHEVAASMAASPIALGPTHRTRGRSRGEGTLRDSIESSHRLLTDDERATHRRLSLLPPGFTIEAATAACTTSDLTAERVSTAITGLVHHSLLEVDGPERPAGPTVFRQLVAIRAHAAEQLRAAGEHGAVQEAVTAWVVHTTRGVRLGQRGQADWYQRLDDNHRTINAALDAAVAQAPSDDALLAIGRLIGYWLDRLRIADGVRLTSTAFATAGPDNSLLARAAVAAAYGSIRAANQDVGPVRDVINGAIGALVDVGAADRLPAAEILLILAAACWVGDDFDLAASAAGAAAELGRLIGDPDVDAIVSALQCSIQLWTDPTTARAGSMAVITGAVNDFASLVASVTLSIAALLDRDGAEGLLRSAEILRLQHQLGVSSSADALETRGNHYVNAGRPVDAVRCYGAAHHQNIRIGRGWPRHPGTAAHLAAARDQLSVGDFDQAWETGERLGAGNLVQDWL